MLQSRVSIAWAAVVVALLSPRLTDAQVVAHGPTPQPDGLVNNLVTGVEYDILNQAKAEQRLQTVQAKLRRDAERGDQAAADHDARRVASLKFRIVVDEWLIRQNSLRDPGCYPFPLRLQSISCAAIAQYRRPTQPPEPLRPDLVQGMQAGSPPAPMTILNAAAPGSGIAFTINGVAYLADGGSRQDLAFGPDSTIAFDAGGSLGQRRYLISPGLFEFRSTPEGWALFKLPEKSPDR